MMWLKGCPKCRGDLIEEAAIGPWVAGARYVSCLQCGYMLADNEEAALKTTERRWGRRVGAA